MSLDFPNTYSSFDDGINNCGLALDRVFDECKVAMENARETNIDMRSAADEQISGLQDELHDAITELEVKKDEASDTQEVLSSAYEEIAELKETNEDQLAEIKSLMASLSS